MQPNPRGKNCAFAYVSRTLNQAESNYSVTLQKILTVVWVHKHFNDINLEYHITVFTDHVPVNELGRANVVAGSLSRNVSVGSMAEASTAIANLTLKDIAVA